MTISGLLETTFLGSKAKQSLDTYSRPEQTKYFPQGGKIQNRDTGSGPPSSKGSGSIDFKHTYFHIPIHEQSRKYLRFHIQGQTYQFKALSFRLSTAPMEFTVIAKELKLMAIHKGIRIHQYPDGWLLRARSHRVCLQNTQAFVEICQKLGEMVNFEKSEMEPKQFLDFVGYQFDPHRAGGKAYSTKYWNFYPDRPVQSSHSCLR